MKHKISHFLSSLWDWISYGLTSLRKSILPKSLLHRFILIILLPLLFLQAIILIFFFDRHWGTVGHRLAQDVVGEITLIADITEKGIVPTENLKELSKELDENLTLSVSYRPNKKIKNTYHSVNTIKVKELLSELEKLPYPFSFSKHNNDQYQVELQLTHGVLSISFHKRRFFSSTVYVFLLWMFSFSILLFFITFLFMKNQIRPIERLSKAAELFGQSQSVANFRPEGATEVRQAGRSFIQMSNRIQRYLNERTGMLSGVSHDLKTPLTRMKLQLSMLEQTEAITELQSDVQEMEHMLEAYLSFARGEGKEQSEKTNLNVMINDLVAKLKKVGQKIDWHQECQIDYLCRPNDLMRAIMNLLTNAGRYASKTQISLGYYRKMIRIMIDDNGPGIPMDKRADVFRAFYRLEKSRNSKTGGIGLGLTIARDIVLSHGGKIELSDSPMGGLRATILLPVTEHQKI